MQLPEARATRGRRKPNQMKRGRDDDFVEEATQQSSAPSGTFSPVHPSFQAQYNVPTFASISPWKQHLLVGGAFQRAKPVPLKRLRDRSVPIGTSLS